MKQLEVIQSIFQIKALRDRIFHTIVFAGIYRLLTIIILPGLDSSELPTAGKFQNLVGKLMGANLDSYSIGALGVGPIISSSILFQMLEFTVPYFQRLRKEGPAGRARISQYVRYTALAMSVVQAVPYLVSAAARQEKHLLIGRYYFYAQSILLLMAGTSFCIWLGDRITEKGIGNGTSVLIMVGIVTKLPEALVGEQQNKADKPLIFVLELVILILIILTIIFFLQGTRRIPIQYARQMAGASNAYGGSRQYLPIKINGAGIMPIIFANMFLSGILFLTNWNWLQKKITAVSWINKTLSDENHYYFNILQALLIFIGTFLYTAIFMNPTEMAENLKRNNGFIPGIKPGKPTINYIDQVIGYVTLPGALFLVLVTLIPLAAYHSDVSPAFSKFYGGSSMLIVIGVVVEIVQQVESHLFNRYYDQMMRFSQSVPEL